LRRAILAGKQTLKISHQRWLYALWLVFIGCFALLHAVHLRADFPNHSPWYMDWAKYTDEGWYGNGAIRAHLFGNWYLPGDLNPAPAVPVWPFLEWVLFFFTGVTIQAARGLAIAFFFVNLLLSYLLLRARGPRWMALLALTLIVTSPFLYCFSRLAILEPMLTAFTLAALNLAVRLPRLHRPVAASVAIGALFTLMMLTKATAVFLLPALGWAMLLPLWQHRKLAVRSTLAAAGAFAATVGLWMALVIHFGLFADYKYLFTANQYIKPKELDWPLVSLWWSFHGGLWVDRILIPLAGLVILSAIPACIALTRRCPWAPADRSLSVGWKPGAHNLLLDPVFGASILAVAGTIFFMTYQNHPQPRYFAVAAIFSFLIVALGAEALLSQTAPAKEIWPRRVPKEILGWLVVAVAALAAAFNGFQTVNYAAHPEYTFVNAAQRLTQYIDTHPNGRRLLVSISGDQITLVTHLPTLCDDYGTPSASFPDLPSKLAHYQPGWYATWNDFDPGTLEDIHTHFSLEEAASFRAFDDPERNVLVLFKLHPLPGGQARSPGDQNLQIPLPGDKISIPVE
jgi:4-amino-4-deoxy-L-arabinose transferase-like glycosyltransferase